jgi:hypothetical protein
MRKKERDCDSMWVEHTTKPSLNGTWASSSPVLRGITSPDLAVTSIQNSSTCHKRNIPGTQAISVSSGFIIGRLHRCLKSLANTFIFTLNLSNQTQIRRSGITCKKEYKIHNMANV